MLTKLCRLGVAPTTSEFHPQVARRFEGIPLKLKAIGLRLEAIALRSLLRSRLGEGAEERVSSLFSLLRDVVASLFLVASLLLIASCYY